MDHIEEHTLELFVLGSDMAQAETERIRTHLATCEGCRALVDRMRESYGQVETTLRGLENRGEELVRVRARADLRPAGQGTPVRGHRPVAGWEQARHFLRRHPVVAGAGALGALALAALLVLQLPDQAARTVMNPVLARANGATGALEVFGAGHAKLWELPVADPDEILQGEKFGLKYTSVLDLDGDGRNEVVTVAQVPEASPAGWKPLLVYSSDRRLEKALLPGSGVTYDGREYAGPFNAHMLATGDFTGAGSQEMVVKVDNGRSPNGIIRYSGSGEVLGEYWHYGIIHALYAMDTDGDGRPELVIAGQNDVEEGRGDTARFAFLAVLEPERIRGQGASMCSPGFGMDRSAAEVLYMRFPQTDMNLLLGRSAFIQRVHVSGASDSVRYSAWFRGATEGTQVLLLEYLLAADFSCVGVRSTDQTDRLHASFKGEQGMQGPLDREYLVSLRRGVRWFDGRQWRTAPVASGGSAGQPGA